MRYVLSLLLVFIVVVGSVAAQESEGDAYIRFANFSPDAVNVHAVVGSARLARDMPYGTVSDWRAVEPGTYRVILGVQATEITVASDTWTTTALVGATAYGNQEIETVTEDYSDMLPGAARVTFVNALAEDASVSFFRDEVPFVTGLRSVSLLEDDVISQSILGVQAGAYTLSARTNEDAYQLGNAAEYDLRDGGNYLVALVGNCDEQQLLVLETPAYEQAVLRGDLENPGTLVEALPGPMAEVMSFAGLTNDLDSSVGYTLLLPAGYYADDLLETYEDDPEALASLLEGHMIRTDMRASDLFARDSVFARNGDRLDITRGEDFVMVNGVRVIDVNIPASNGTIHILNNILPQ